MPSTQQWLSLYHSLQREASLFQSYSYREFFRRRIRDHFIDGRPKVAGGDSKQAEELYKKGTDTLATLKRQRIIDNLYPESKLVIEKK